VIRNGSLNNDATNLHAMNRDMFDGDADKPYYSPLLLTFKIQEKEPCIGHWAVSRASRSTRSAALALVTDRCFISRGPSVSSSCEEKTTEQQRPRGVALVAQSKVGQ